MPEHPNNHKLTGVLNALRPWVTAIVVVLILNYTGALGQIRTVTHSALISTGLLEASPAVVDTRSFDYNFLLHDLQGNRVDVNDFRGKVIFLNLWATWCGPCRAEMPSIEKLYASAASEDIVFVMLSIDRPENRHKVVSYIEQKEFTFPVYTPADNLPEILRIPNIPTTFIIGKDGEVRAKEIGATNYNREKYRRLLSTLAAE